jgi:hypothetical protein
MISQYFIGQNKKPPCDDALPFGPLWYAGPNAVSNAIGYAKFRSRSHDAVMRVYDEAGNVIATHEHAGEFKRPRAKQQTATRSKRDGGPGSFFEKRDTAAVLDNENGLPLRMELRDVPFIFHSL